MSEPSRFENTPRISGIKIYSQHQDMKASRIADTLSSLLSMPLESMVAMFKDYAFYESEYTPMVKSVLRIYSHTNSLSDKQRVALAMYLASRPSNQ